MLDQVVSAACLIGCIFCYIGYNFFGEIRYAKYVDFSKVFSKEARR